MRWFAAGAVLALCAGCGQAPTSTPDTSTDAASPALNPARIDRVRDRVPDGYEVAAYTGPASPIVLWGLGDSAAADPPQCLSLAEPTAEQGTARGWSASGPGGIIYAVVAASPLAPNAGLADECRSWRIDSARSSATVTGVTAPAVETAETWGMRSEARTVVEGGTETRTHADTFVAQLDGHVCFVAVVTDPGATHPALTTDFAADLLTETVAALRG